MEHAVKTLLRIIGCALLAACGPWACPAACAAVTAERFGTLDGHDVEIYTLTNAHGLEARITAYGATLVSLKTPDRDGHLQNIVLGFDNLASYLAAAVPYYGATVGRYANRIAAGRFTIDGSSHQLPLNDGPNSLHGGKRGFDKRLWTADRDTSGNRLRLTYVSADGEEGYPGELTAHVTYRLGDDDSLHIDFEATTTAPTPVNLANHAYFNLSGDPGRSIVDHLLQINAAAFTPVDATLIPTGELRPVSGTVFDFRRPTPIGRRIGAHDEQLAFGHGYDHNWVLAPAPMKGALRRAAVLTDPGSGRELEVDTTQPGLQFYSGNFMDGKPSGQGSVFGYRTGLCLETQHFPDSPNHPAFPNTILRPGETYAERTVLRFRTTRKR
ncbi:MAG TPA: aldose epimerase family protein [Burkholderiaceae bacterium]|nr:aldose epimerase family protein [Burkholderiaceae bacterium]